MGKAYEKTEQEIEKTLKPMEREDTQVYSV